MTLQEKVNKSESQARGLYQAKLGVYLKARREEAKLSQGDIADIIGLETPQFISNIERGMCAVPNYILRTMISQYRIEEREFLNFLSDLKVKFYSKVLFEKKVG